MGPSFFIYTRCRISFFVHCASNWANRRYLGSLLNPGTLTAPGRFRLVLLRSRPDTIHRFPSRETQTSTSLSKGSFTSICPLRNITPAIADCRCKVPLPPRLHESYCIVFRGKSQHTSLPFVSCWCKIIHYEDIINRN